MQVTKSYQLQSQLAPLIGLVLLITGCASGLTRNECQTADWRTIGYEDGVNGRHESRIGYHRKACARHGVALVLDAYQHGRAEGIQRYCQPEKGYRQGRNGKGYSGVCPPELEPGYLQAYANGRELYDQSATVQRIERTLRKSRARLTGIEVEMRDKGLALVVDDASMEQRIILLDEIRKLEEERSATLDRIPILESELEAQKQQLAILRSQHNY